jgi:SAM-dependent methyltransferase
MKEEPQEGDSVLQDPGYLDFTYSLERAPFGPYPDLLARHLLTTVYHRPGRLLDIGSGRGDHLHAFSRLGFEVEGVDISPTAQRHADPFPVTICDLEREEIPLPDGDFDFIFSKSVVEHLRNPMTLFKSAFRLLKPGGVAAIMTPSWAHTYWGPFYIDHTHVTPFTAPSLADALRIAGFGGIRVTHFRQLPFLWKYPLFLPVAWFFSMMPLPYRPYQPAPWPDGLNKIIRFSKEVMLLGSAKKLPEESPGDTLRVVEVSEMLR